VKWKSVLFVALIVGALDLSIKLWRGREKAMPAPRRKPTPEQKPNRAA
jgi:hypothetical protein